MKDDLFNYLVATEQLDEFLGKKMIDVYQSEGDHYIKLPFLGKYKYLGGMNEVELTPGKIYNRVGELNEFRIVDDSEEDYLYPSDYFEKIGKGN